MYQTINVFQFEDAFIKCERQTHFSRDGLSCLYNHLEEYEGSDNKGIELDVIGLCCTYTEYEDFDEFEKEYSDLCEDEDIRNIDDISHHTTLIIIKDYNDKDTGSFIIEQF